MNPDQQPTTPTPPQPAPQTDPAQAIRYIAVDANGNPLPNQPAIVPVSSVAQDAPQSVYMSRPLEPNPPQISEEIHQRHEAAKRTFPNLNLSDGEYIVSAVKRHPIGLLSIWAVVGVCILILLSALIAFNAYRESALANGALTSLPSAAIVSIPIILLMALALVVGYVATIIYNGNKFFLTNESVIQELQVSLFSKQEQTVSLSNIEDASFTQNGIIQSIVGYGSIRLSTEGDETTYRFHYVSNPKQQVALLNNAVEAFKNGRPVSGD